MSYCGWTAYVVELVVIRWSHSSLNVVYVSVLWFNPGWSVLHEQVSVKIGEKKPR